jgi:hypothetical protein
VSVADSVDRRGRVWIVARGVEAWLMAAVEAVGGEEG